MINDREQGTDKGIYKETSRNHYAPQRQPDKLHTRIHAIKNNCSLFCEKYQF